MGDIVRNRQSGRNFGYSQSHKEKPALRLPKLIFGISFQLPFAADREYISTKSKLHFFAGIASRVHYRNGNGIIPHFEG
jgi:hypothetical protein